MKNLSIILLLVLSVGLFRCGPITEESETQKVIVVQLNDVYEIAPLEGGAVGGLARVATLLHTLEKEAPVISVLAGDFLSPSLLGTLRVNGEKIAGQQMVESLNAMGLDYVTFGNHEFDLAEATLLDRIDASDFTWISTNTFHQTPRGIVPFTQKGVEIPRSVVHKVPFGKDTLRIAFTGVCLPFNQQEYVKYEGETATTQQELAKLNYDFALGITHLNWYDDTTYASENPQLPLIMGGHDHENMRLVVGDQVVTKADANAKTAYVHRISYTPSSGKVSIVSDLVDIDASLASDPKVEQVVSHWDSIGNRAIEEMGYDADEVLMQTTESLDGRESSIRNFPTNLGTLTCEAMMQHDPRADAALFNSGSIRLDDQLSGTITMYDMLRTYPYGGGVVVTEMPGADVLKVLAIGFVENVGIGGYLQSAGIDSTAAGVLAIGGRPIEPGTQYRIWMTEFMSQGLEANLELLKDYTYESPTTLGDGTRNDIRDVVADYMRKQ